MGLRHVHEPKVRPDTVDIHDRQAPIPVFKIFPWKKQRPTGLRLCNYPKVRHSCVRPLTNIRKQHYIYLCIWNSLNWDLEARALKTPGPVSETCRSPTRTWENQGRRVSEQNEHGKTLRHEHGKMRKTLQNEHGKTLELRHEHGKMRKTLQNEHGKTLPSKTNTGRRSSSDTNMGRRSKMNTGRRSPPKRTREDAQAPKSW